jgi:ribose/xylose/arabinose/galactoside ABC-type transport system permease subunit
MDTKQETAEPRPSAQRAHFFRTLRSKKYFGSLVTLAVVMIIFAAGTKGGNLSPSNFQNILSLAGLFLIAVQGMTLVFLVGGMDLSTEGIIALSAVVSGLLIRANPAMIFPVMLLALCIGFASGVLSGVINTKLKMPSFLVTLGMWYVTRGLAVIVIKGQQYPVKNELLKYMVDGKLFGFIPFIALISLVVFVIFFFLQRQTAFGKHLYGIGGNEFLAIQAGVRADRVKVIVFGIAGASYALVGFFLMSRLQLTTSQMGSGYMFPAVIATVLGGTAMSGGAGGAVNAVIGALAYQFLQNGLVMMNVNVYAQAAVNGVVLVAAITASMDRRKIGIIK